jgi:hypothetical protein
VIAFCLAVMIALSASAQALTRVGGQGGCFSVAADDPCSRIHGVFGFTGFANDLSAFALSPNGRNLYVAVPGAALSRNVFTGPRDSSLLTFARNPVTGRLRQLRRAAGCLSAVANNGCASARGISYLADVIVSPDGRFVYTAAEASRGVAAFARDPATGALHQLPGPSGCLLDGHGHEACAYAPIEVKKPKYGTTISVRSSPDGRYLYLLGRPLPRDPVTGAIASPPRASCAAGVVYPTCSEVQVLPVLAFTRDGRDAYELLSGLNPRGLAVDPATGELRALTGAPPCWPVAGGSRCDGEQLQAESFTLSPDERQLYVTLGVQDAIVTFTRDPASGLLARRPELATCGGRSSRPPCAAVATPGSSLRWSGPTAASASSGPCTAAVVLASPTACS